MWIENVPASSIANRMHIDAGPNSMLIQILDPCSTFPVPKHQFKEIHQFEFLDIEDDDIKNGSFPEDVAIQEDQAVKIARLLKRAFENRMHVVVHCHAGLCRSGAVAEVGIMMGFQDTERTRIPNLRVKQKLLRALGMDFDPNESPLLLGADKYNF